MFSNTETENLFFKELSKDDFLDIGMNQIAYVKPMKVDEEKSAYSVHAADGTQISVMDTYDTAVAAVRFNDMYPVTLQ